MGVRYFREIVAGGLSRADVWANAQYGGINFVDGDHYSSLTAGAGYSPKQAVKDVSAAITNLAGVRQAVIYVRPKSDAGSNQTYYTDNITIPITMAGLRLVGAGGSQERPYIGAAIKASNSLADVIAVKASDVHIEGFRLAGTGQNAVVGVSVISNSNYGTASGMGYGMQVYKCRIDNSKVGGGAGIKLDTPVFVEIIGCSFDECADAIMASYSYMSYAARGLIIKDCDFGGRTTTRDCDIYISQCGAGNSIAGSTHTYIKDCDFLDGLPAHASGAGNNRFIKIVNADVGSVINSTFFVDPGSNHITTYGVAGSQCVIPNTWVMTGCRGGGTDLDFIHPLAA